MIYVKIHRNNESFVTAVCDEELLNKTFKEGNLILNVSEYFYKGKLIKEEEAENILRDTISLNLVGKRSVNIALKLKLISSDNIKAIQGIQHAQSILL